MWRVEVKTGSSWAIFGKRIGSCWNEHFRRNQSPEAFAFNKDLVCFSSFNLLGFWYLWVSDNVLNIWKHLCCLVLICAVHSGDFSWYWCWVFILFLHEWFGLDLLNEILPSSAFIVATCHLFLFYFYYFIILILKVLFLRLFYLFFFYIYILQ